MIRKSKLLFFVIPISVFLSQYSCRTGGGQSSVSVPAEEGAATSPRIEPDFIFHFADSSIARFFYRFQASQFLFSRDTDGRMTCDIRINLRAWKLGDSRSVADTATVTLIKQQMDGGADYQIMGGVDLQIPSGAEYRVRIQIKDAKRGVEIEKEEILDRRTFFTRSNYRVDDPTTGDIFYANSISGSQVKLQNRFLPFHEYEIRFYSKEFNPALPPFSERSFEKISYQADSISYKTSDSLGQLQVKLPESGFVHVVADTSTRSGITLFLFGKYFPRLTNPEDLVFPLRYIVSTDEYKGMLSSPDKKKAVDDFWLQRSGSRERARMLIKSYYSRVEEANREFSSFTQGWKTDRGMIRIIFGSPSYIERTDDSETWIYGDRFSAFSLRFNFIRVKNPFSGNDFYLERQISFKPHWYEAVETWRSGRTYTYRR